MAAKSNGIDMVEGSLWSKILKFALFYMTTALMQQLYNMADIMVVGRYAGQSALAGVGACTNILNLFLGFILGLSAGITIVIGQAIGGKNRDEIQKASHTAIAASICCGVATFAICISCAKMLLEATAVPEEVMPEAFNYLRIASIGYIPSLIYNFGSAILSAKGDSKRPLYIVSVSGVINVALNVFFVCVYKNYFEFLPTSNI